MMNQGRRVLVSSLLLINLGVKLALLFIGLAVAPNLKMSHLICAAIRQNGRGMLSLPKCDGKLSLSRFISVE